MLSNSSKYALRALIYLGKQKNQSFVSIEELSKVTKVPGPYLSKLIKIIGENGLVETRRGAAGGVRLPANRNITFFEICQALNDPVVKQGCFISNSACNKANPCEYHARWSKMREDILNLLGGAEVIRRQH